MLWTRRHISWNPRVQVTFGCPPTTHYCKHGDCLSRRTPFGASFRRPNRLHGTPKNRVTKDSDFARRETQAIRDALETFRATVEAEEMTGFKDGGLGRMAAGKQSVGTGSASRIENTDE
jgi:hypothetical protein